MNTMTIDHLFNQQVKDLIAEYNINSKMNTFLYNNKDVHQWFRQKYLKSEYSDYHYDRFVFVDRCNKIEEELLLLIRDQFNDREVIVTDQFTGKEFKGKIEINLTRTYTSEGQEHTTKDHMAMRGVNDGNALDEQTIAFWVVTGDRMSTHLYTADRVVLAFPNTEEQDILISAQQVPEQCL